MTRRHVLRWGALVASAGIVLGQNGSAQGPGFGFGGGELQLVERYDVNGDGRLDTAERAAARKAAASQGGGRRFGRFMGGVGGGTPEPGRQLGPKDVRAYGNEHLYDLGVLRTIFLTFESADWEQELADFHNTDVEVPATMTVDGQVFRDVGVGFRGASSFMMVPAGFKRSLNISIDFVHGKQRLGGYRTLNLLNSANDPTFLRTVLYTEIARQYIPIPRMNYVRVVINGESWGVYLNAQQFNTDLVRDYFKADGGARWKVPGSPRGMGGLEYLGDSAEAYRGIYEIRSRDREQSWAALANLAKVLNETPPAALEAALRPILDVDGALKFLALEVALVNSDGYWSRASDYNLYQEPNGRFHLIPHDVNEAFGVGGGGGFGGGGRGGGTSLDPLVCANDASKPLCSRLLAVPALRARYLGYIRDIADRWLDWSRLEPTVERYRALIADDVKADTRKLYSTEEFDSGVAGIRQFVTNRRAFLLQ